MKNKTLRLRGAAVGNELAPTLDHADKIVLSPKGRVRLGAAREAGGVAELKNIAPHDVACIEYSNGFKLWLRVDELYREQGARTARGAVDVDADVWEIDPRVRRDATERGPAGLAIEALEFFGVDLKGVAAEKLSGWFELRQLGNREGLHRCRLAGAFGLEAAKLPAQAGPDDPPLLVLLHGTASSAKGSFGKLWAGDNREGVLVRERLQQLYGEWAYAWEHRSLTVSPIDNAIGLAQALPQGARLHLVSHSRGGLVGELLCLGQRKRAPDALDKRLLDRLFAADRTLGEVFGFGKRQPAAYPEQRRKLEQLLKLLDAKQFQITRFVRVACPARGTTLASGRLDRWLSILGHLAADTLVDDAVDFLLAVVKKRTDPRTLPGLEAMMPGSAVVRLLNHPDLEVAADLSVVAGDIEGESFLGKLKWIVADWFYSGEHDLVVNTGSMYGGARRPGGGARFVFDQGKDVSHFNYFANARTVKFLAAGLTRPDGGMAGFQPMEAAKHEEPAWRAAVARSATLGPRPVAILLPGTMGSQLAVGKDRIWLSYWDLARGRLEDLGAGARDVAPLDLLDDYYGDLLAYLARSHRVEPFAYDWRVSVLASADRLAGRMRELLPWCEQHGQPLRVIAHSMGGLVMRALIARHRELWTRIGRLKGSRFLMLGTPNAGSFETVRWLTGWNPTLRKLTLLDLAHDRDDLVDIVRRYPGLLELLPSNDAARDFSQRRLWEQLQSEAKESWPLPEARDLASAAATFGVIKDSPIDKRCMIYVAGWAPQTVCDYEVVQEEQPGDSERAGPVLRFYATKEGDGTVTWASGLLPEVPTWYVEDASHDELPAHEPAFAAYLELLQTGSTSRLSPVPPAASRAATPAEARSPMPLGLPDSIPGEEDLAGFVFGAAPPRRGRKRRRLPRVTLGVRHGDLAYARYPICVGHYQGDTIVSAEAHLDRRLDRALSNRARLGLYPGPLGTQEIFIHRDPKAKPRGAVVVGLGQVGELSPGGLETGIARAALEYALTVANWADDRFGPKDAVRSARLSCLFIGTGFGNLTLRDSMESILRGIQAANRRLVETGFDDRVLIDEIEFLELYQDVAIRAARTLDNILLDGALEEHFVWPERELQEGRGARRRVLFEEAPNWWQRLEIVHDAKRGELRFIALTDRARAEESLVAGQLRLAEDFIRTVQAQTGQDSEIARTLYEMLLPNRLKELAPNQYDVVLVVDEVAARFPWEMLEDRWTVNGWPLAVAAGMLRQLKTPTWRPRPAHAFGDTACVVGNPKLPAAAAGGLQFPDLPGAAREAEEVAAVLREAGYRVAERINAEAGEILVDLHADGYRILHLAGHGVHEQEVATVGKAEIACPACEQIPPERTKRVSGMVIGPDVYLTPGDVEQMRWVPDLVFINCCHLGSTASGNPAWSRYSALAANLATQFINMGVKAVVAAGWAVDDAAALNFARAFYRNMLAGTPFGEAVRRAREEIYDRHPGVNTWGAYQCYGDPDFRLVEEAGDGGSRRPPYHAAAELVADLDNLAGQARSGAGDESKAQGLREYLDALLARVPERHREKWLQRADVNAALGIAYGELGEFDQAIAHLTAAIAANDAELPLRAVEQRASFREMRALRAWQAARGAKPKRGAKTDAAAAAAAAEILAAIEDLAALIRMGPTVERHALLGSAYKRLAWIAADARESEEALANMAANYHDALALGAARDELAPYPLTNWLIAEAMLAWHGIERDASWRQLADGLCERAVEEARRRDQTDPDFWTGTVESDCRLALGIVRGGFDAQAQREVVEGYRRAMEAGASRKEQDTVRVQLDFVADMAQRAGQDALADALRAMRLELT